MVSMWYAAQVRVVDESGVAHMVSDWRDVAARRWRGLYLHRAASFCRRHLSWSDVCRRAEISEGWQTWWEEVTRASKRRERLPCDQHCFAALHSPRPAPRAAGQVGESVAVVVAARAGLAAVASGERYLATAMVMVVRC